MLKMHDQSCRSLQNLQNLKATSFKQYKLHKHCAPQLFSTQQQVLQVELHLLPPSLYSAAFTGFAPECLRASLPPPLTDLLTAGIKTLASGSAIIF